MMPGTLSYVHSQSDHDSAAFDLESTLRLLLCAAGFDAARLSDVNLSFDVCLDGRTYSVLIVEYAPDTDARPALSPRELDVVQLIAKGLPNKAIASKLELSPSTVNTYTKRIYLKLNVNSRAEMVAKVLRAPLRGFHGSPPEQANW